MTDDRASLGPVLFAYDGSELAKLGIAEAGRLLGPGRDALVLVVWQAFNVGFLPPGEFQLDAAQTADVEKAAQHTAAEGASLAEQAGFRSRSLAVDAAPTWKGIVHVADQYDVSLIALASHGRTGIASMLIGSVAEAVAAHSKRSVLIVHGRS